MIYKHILAATDLDEPNDPVVMRAASMAIESGAKLTAVYILPPLPAVYTTYDPFPAELNLAKILSDKKERLEGRIQSEIPGKLKVECLTREGNVRDEIIQAAKDVGADLIVLGTHGRRGLSRLLLGSIAEGVVRLAPVSVLIVR